MASYQNGQPYYPTGNHPSSGQNSSHLPYASHPHYPSRPLERTPSFDAGDDERYLDGDQTQARGPQGYPSYAGPAGASPPVNRAQSTDNHAPSSIPFRTNTQHAALGGYQHQYQPGVPAHAPYNPAQYQLQQAGYSPQAFVPLQSPNLANAYQPYIPAAYGDPNLTRQSSVYNSYGYYDANSQLNHSASQPPPPPRRSEQPQYPSPQAYGAYQHDLAQQQYPVHQPNTSPAGQIQPAYSPPAPAPPPHNASLLDRRYSRSTSSPEDRHSSASAVSAPHRNSALTAQPSPDINRNSSFASRMSNQSSSSQPSLATPPTRNTSSTSPQRTNTLNRHPQGRSLPGVPSESESDNDYFNTEGSRNASTRVVPSSGYDDLMHDLDEAIGGGSQHARSSSDLRHRDPRNDGPNGLSQQASPNPALFPDEVPTHLNGNIASTGDTYINYGAFTDDSDAEAAAGLAAMRALDEQERAEDARRRSGSATLFPSQTRPEDTAPRLSSQDPSSDSDYTGYDLSSAGGGYVPDLSYGEAAVSDYAAAAAMPQSELYGRLNTRMSSVRSSAISSEGRDSQASGYDSMMTAENIHSFSAVPNVARVDTGGTGGLTEPSPHPRRLSYEDGDEATLLDSETGQASGDTSPSRESMPDLFFHPGMQQRPLPPPPSLSDPGVRIPHLMPAGTYTQQSRFSQYTDSGARGYPAAPDAHTDSLLSPSTVPRSTSLSSTRSAPKVEHPMRSKTDSDRQKLLRQQGRPMSDLYDIASPQSAVGLDLPAIPKKRYNPAKLTNDQFKKCSEPWALSSVVAWIRELAEEEADLKENNIAEGIVALFMNKVPTMYITEAEALGGRVVREMLAANALVKEEEWVKFGPGTTSGVLYQLTGSGCYSSKLHLYPARGRCYSYHCMRTLKKLDLDTLPVEKTSEDWVTFYKLKKEDVESHEKKEIERQNNLHEIVSSEDTYISQLDVLRVLYRDRLAVAQPPIVPAKKLPAFLRDVFGGVDKVKKVNQDYLLGQLKYRQTEQGPWIVGFSDIFREWIRKARPVYVEYASNFPRADYLMRREAERNMHFKSFLDQAREDKRSSRLGWDNYLKAPITRLQRYSLLLATVQKNMLKESEEKNSLSFALDEIRAATFECDSKFAEMTKKMELIEMQTKLRLRPPMEKEVELNLDHLGREIIFRGELQRAGGKGFQWVDTHAILFDHYLVLAKPLSRDRKEGYYDVSKLPIPMDLLVLESANDPAVVKSSVKGIGAVTTAVVPRGQPIPDARLARAQSTASGGQSILTHTNTSLSIGSGNASQSMVPITTLESGSSKEEKIMYPFRIKHLGKTETYTLYAPSAQNRQDWCEAIIQAKTRHAEALFSQNAEPFKIRVLADTAFGYESLSYPGRRILIRGTPLDRAVQETEKRFEGQGRPAPVCKATVNCATVFNQPYGRLMCAVGTDYGVYISEYQNSRGWFRAIQMQRVSQIAVLEEFNLFLLISDKALIAYHLDVVCPPSGNAVAHNDASSRKAPQKLSGSKDIGFFVTGKMKERTLVFYKKRDGIASTFKVLEPVLQKSTTTRSRFLPSASRRGQTEFFREYDEFYIPAECYSLNLFQSTLAISTARGVEVLTLEKKQTWSVPNLRSDQPETQAHLSSIASRIKELKPLGMFRLGEAEFLVTFEECAVYVNKHGDISRGVVMEFVGRAKSACLYAQYLILVEDDFVEIRDAQNGRLKQVIVGKDIRLLDDGGGGSGGPQTQTQAALGGGINGLGLKNFGNAPRTPKLVLQHPEHEKSHIIVELLLTTELE